MNVTDEFQWFAFNTLHAFEKGFSSDEEFRELVFERLDELRERGSWTF